MALGYLYVGDPTSKATTRLKLESKPQSGSVVAFLDPTDSKFLAQEAPPPGKPRDSYGVFGRRLTVGPWEKFSLTGQLLTSWTGDVYIWVELPPI